MKRFLTAPVAALAVLLIGTFAHASNLPPDQIAWSYNWAPSAPAVLATGNPSAGVTFTNEPDKVAVGSSDVVATNLRVFSSATAAAPDVITSTGNYTLSLKLSANDGGNVFTQTLTFSGTLAGTFSAESSNITDMFTDAGPKEAVLGTIKFTVSLIAYTPPGPPDQANAGSLAAHVTVENVTANGGVPEPSSIVLCGMGVTFLGGAAWRRLRRKAAVPA